MERMATAFLLIAHGSRQAEANADLHYLAEELRRRQRDRIVEAAFLELAEPGIAEAARRCVEQGADRVILLPCFLSAGVHVQRDLHDHCHRLADEFPAVTFHLAEPLGRHPLLCEVLIERARQAENDLGE
jgi:sirohydrochlorin ferrochelatase